MFSQQVDYWKNQETIRHNAEAEKLQAEANVEAARHNKASEVLSAQRMAADMAMAQAKLDYSYYSEQRSHDLTWAKDRAAAYGKSVFVGMAYDLSLQTTSPYGQPVVRQSTMAAQAGGPIARTSYGQRRWHTSGVEDSSIPKRTDNAIYPGDTIMRKW